MLHNECSKKKFQNYSTAEFFELFLKHISKPIDWQGENPPSTAFALGGVP